MNRIENLGGVEILELGAMADEWLKATNKRRWLINFPVVGSMMKQIANGNLTCPETTEDSITWEKWLQKKYAD